MFLPFFLLDTLLAARNGLNGFIMSSNYETDIEFGRGKRKKIERQPFSFDSPNTQMIRKTVNIIQSSDSDSNSDDPGTLQFTSKTNVAAPPVVFYKSQNNKNEPRKSTKHDKNIKTKIVEKPQSTKNTIVTSLQNKKSRKEIMLTKISEALKSTSAIKDNREEIIEAARQKQQTCDTKQLEISSASLQHDMSQKYYRPTNVSSEVRISPPKRCNVEKNEIYSIPQHKTSMEVETKKKIKENQRVLVASLDNDISHPKKCTRYLESTASMSEENIFDSCDDESIEKSLSVITTHSQSEFSESIDAFHQIKELSCSRPRSGIIIINFNNFFIFF